MSVDTDKPSATRSAVNAANAITVARILLIPVFVVLLVSDIPYGQYLAIAVFAVAAFTDKLDGYVARSRGQITTLGQFLDPLADKLLISAALIALVGLGTALRVVGIDQGVSIPAGTLGKAKTTSQIVCIIILMWPHGHSTWTTWIEVIAVALMVALTLISGIQYFVKARDNLHLPGSGR